MSEQPYLGRALLAQILGKVLEKVHQTLPVIFKLVRLLRLTAVHPGRNKRKGINYKRYAKERISLNICCWNVKTLLDREASSRPERRTALVTRELQRLNIDIAALSETHLQSSGSGNRKVRNVRAELVLPSVQL